jgi:hypothetical protein
VGHLRANGFTVKSNGVSDTELLKIKIKYAVPESLQSCHTAIVENYVIEGHVPADVILRLLKEKPAVAGLAVPGMPIGSPGMEGGKPEPYSVYTFDRAGKTNVYATR